MRIFWFFVRLYDSPAIINKESAKIIMQAIKTSCIKYSIFSIRPDPLVQKYTKVFFEKCIDNICQYPLLALSKIDNGLYGYKSL